MIDALAIALGILFGLWTAPKVSRACNWFTAFVWTRVFRLRLPDGYRAPEPVCSRVYQWLLKRKVAR